VNPSSGRFRLTISALNSPVTRDGLPTIITSSPGLSDSRSTPDLANWEAQDSQLRATLTAPPASGGTADTTGQSDRMARLSAHEQNMATFRTALQALEQKMNAENANHDEAYAEYQRLKAQYDMLRQEHESMAMGGGATGAAGDTTARY